MSEIEFEVVSYDVNGIGDDRKRRKIFNFLKRQTSNKAVIFTQEIDSAQATGKRFKYQWGGKCYSVTEPQIAQESVFALDIIWNIKS